MSGTASQPRNLSVSAEALTTATSPPGDQLPRAGQPMPPPTPNATRSSGHGHRRRRPQQQQQQQHQSLQLHHQLGTATSNGGGSSAGSRTPDHGPSDLQAEPSDGGSLIAMQQQLETLTAQLRILTGANYAPPQPRRLSTQSGQSGGVPTIEIQPQSRAQSLAGGGPMFVVAASRHPDDASSDRHVLMNPDESTDRPPPHLQLQDSGTMRHPSNGGGGSVASGLGRHMQSVDRDIDAASQNTDTRRRKHYRPGGNTASAVRMIDTPTSAMGIGDGGPSSGVFGNMRSRRGSNATNGPNDGSHAPGGLARTTSGYTRTEETFTPHPRRGADLLGGYGSQANFGAFSVGDGGQVALARAASTRNVPNRGTLSVGVRSNAGGPLVRREASFVNLVSQASANNLGPVESNPNTDSCDDQAGQSVGLGHRRVVIGESDVDHGAVGLNEEHPFVSVMDIVYILNTIACSIVAISGVNPRIDIENTPGLLVTSICLFAFSTVFTAGWIALRFFVQARRGDWEIVDRMFTIRKYYLRTWFAFDMLTFFPIEWAFVVWQWDTFYIIEMRHILRIARIVSLGSSGNPLRGSRIWYRFLSFCVAYALIIHILASGFGAVEDLNYLDSLYWAVLTITSVGYGDVVPVTEGGKMYAIFAMIVGVLLIASMTAFATSVLTTKDKLTEDTDEKKSLMDAMLSYYDVPWDVRRDVIQMFPSVLEAQSENTFRHMSEAMPNFVARRVDAFARAKLLRTVPLFKNLTDTQMVLELSQLMTRRFVPVGEYVVNYGDVGTEMFFIIRGVVEVLAPSADDPEEEIVVASLRGGEFFGEIALLKDVVRTASVQAVTLTELLVLDKEHVDPSILAKLAGLVATELRQRVKGDGGGGPTPPQRSPGGTLFGNHPVAESGSDTSSSLGDGGGNDQDVANPLMHPTRGFSLPESATPPQAVSPSNFIGEGNTNNCSEVGSGGRNASPAGGEPAEDEPQPATALAME